MACTCMEDLPISQTRQVLGYYSSPFAFAAAPAARSIPLPAPDTARVLILIHRCSAQDQSEERK